MSQKRVFANDSDLNFSEYNRKIHQSQIQQKLLSTKFMDYNTFSNFKSVTSNCEPPCSINSAVNKYNHCHQHYECKKTTHIDKTPPVKKTTVDCAGINCCYYCAKNSCCGKCLNRYNVNNKFNKYNLYNRYSKNDIYAINNIYERNYNYVNFGDVSFNELNDFVPPPQPFNNQINLP